MATTLYVNPDPATEQARAVKIGCGWMPTVPPQYASIATAPCVIIAGGGLPPVVLPETATKADIAAGLAPILAAEQAQAAATATQAGNQSTVQQQAQAALAANRTYLGIASPSNAQVAAQVKALTQQANGLIRLALQQFDGTN